MTTTFLTPQQASAWQAFLAQLQGIPLITDEAQIARLSQDWHSLSPVLSRQLSHKRGDLIVCPGNEAEVLQVAQACVAHRVPITIRGGGMANYGQSVPLQGGIVLDMSRMQQICWLKPGSARVEAGVRPLALEKQAREIGWELRLIPSTFRTATMAGFIAGGSGGVGSIAFGGLRARGNILGVRVVTLEDHPRVLELRGDEIQKVNHGWGLNGIITEVEIPLAPASPWAEAILTFRPATGETNHNALMRAVRCGYALAASDGIPKRLLSLQAWPIPTYFPALRPFVPEGSHCVQVIYFEPNHEALEDLAQEYGGNICWQKPAGEVGRSPTLMEYCFNHTVLHARAADPGITAIQGKFPAQGGPEMVEHLVEHFGDELMMHFEYNRMNGTINGGSGHLVRFSSEERLQEMMHYEKELGCLGPNVHSYFIEEVGRNTPHLILDFKREMDPYGLLNPGKTRCTA